MQSAVRGAKKKINMEIRKSSEERKVLDVSCLLTLETERLKATREQVILVLRILFYFVW